MLTDGLVLGEGLEGLVVGRHILHEGQCVVPAEILQHMLGLVLQLQLKFV